MRQFVSVIILLLTATFGFAQPYGNEWINHNQSYYKFGITEDGVFRIDYQTLVNAGISINAIQSNQFQIFGREKEIPLHIQDNGDNSFDTGDYMEFYAKGNDGWLDSLLYDNPSDIGNPAYSLHSDTIYYYLTWTTSSTKRFVEETDINFSIYSPQEYVIEKTEKNYNSRYYGGTSKYSSYSSFYSPGEGWGGSNHNGASGYTKNINLSTPNVYTGSGAPAATFQAKSNANSNASYTGSGNHHLRWSLASGGVILKDRIFIGYGQTNVDTSFNVNELTSGTTNILFQIVGDQGATTDYQSIHYLSINYPRTPSMDGASKVDWELENASGQGKIRLDITNTNLVNPSAYVFNGNVARKIPLVNAGSTWQGLIPNTSNGNNQHFVVYDESEIQSISSIAPVNGNARFTDYSVLNVEDAYIIIYNNSMQTSASQYAAYRGSAAGGNYNVILCDINDAWMQYGGGIPKNILGIRRLANHIYNLSTAKPKAMLLLGKGISYASSPNTGSGYTPRKNDAVSALNLVPSFGFPASDVCITAKWNGSSSIKPAIPTGRIAAQNDTELTQYLAKVQIYEAAQNQNSTYSKPLKDWQKQVLHFGGGSTSSEQSLLQGYLSGMENTIEDAQFGGNVNSYYKETSDPFNPVQTSEVNEKLENGVSLITFFGHASADGFDQNIDDPVNWNNTGKYPMVIGNGCYTGDIYTAGNNSTSENFVLIDNLGAIGFLASTKTGYASFLNLYTAELYRQISTDNYGATIGKQIQNTIGQINGTNSSFLTETTSMQMTLHCDPAIRLNWHEKPEIDLTTQDVSFAPNQIDLSTDSLTVNVVLTNLGKSIEDTFGLAVIRNFPNSTIDSVYNLSINGLDYKDTFYLKIPIQIGIGAGMNEFSIQADLPSFVPEQFDEFNNNEVTINHYVNVDGIRPVLPYNYAVIPDDSVVLKASTIDPTAAFNTYRFEIDTTDLFNSPFRRYAVKSGLGGVKEVFPAEWKKVGSNAAAPLILEDSVSYFWRVSVDSSVYNWNEYSFQYIPNKRGWGQDHFFQFKNGGFSGIEYDRTTRKRNFEPQQATLTGHVYDNANSLSEYNGTLWKINGQNAEYGMCTTSPSLHVGVVDPATLEPWGTFYDGINTDHQFGNVIGCRNRVEQFFIFRQNSASQMQSFENMVNNEVPDGHYMIIYSTSKALYSQWQPSLFTTMQELGATNITPSSPERSFIFIVKKGDPSSAAEMHAQMPNEFINFSKTFTGPAGNGVEASTIIGPAAEWETLYWKQYAEENPTEDSTRLLIRGLDINQNVQLEIDTLFSTEDSIVNLNALLPASTYPYLQLQANYTDEGNLTPAQVDRWHVLYQDLPEAAIDGSSGLTFLPNSQDSLQEGTEMSFAIDVKNISDLNMDSLLVHYWISDKNQTQLAIPYNRQDSLKSGEVLRDTISFPTIGLAGENTLWMEVNPYVNGNMNQFLDQPELAHFNNVLQIPFTLQKDDINPILDVTFDGEHILNGDIVSPKSEIVMNLTDENPFLVMDEDADTSNFGVYLTYPNGEQKQIPFMNNNGKQMLQWIPADESNLRFKIIYNANLEKSGTYELMVQGSDNSGNLSGDIEYKVQFDVVLESSITHLMNYPNPFSTQTKFVFTLTGDRVPDEMIIQIMTVTGRIVREITEDELGPIRIGRNITSYAWDGRDEFGDPLANGVYLYRVKAEIQGEKIEHRNSGADQFFKKNWGKMYLMR